MSGNWASLSGFQVGTYGPLYAIQDPAAITDVLVSEPASGVPRVNALQQNRPNPFNPATEIRFSLASRGRVAIRVFDVGGRVVRTLVDRGLPEGDHAVRWNGDLDGGGRAASGIYFYRITYPDGAISAKKMTMLR